MIRAHGAGLIPVLALLACSVLVRGEEASVQQTPEAQLSESVPAVVESNAGQLPLAGDAGRGRLLFGQCRTCHYAEPFMGHNNGPNLNRIFGKVAGKQEGFDYYSATFKAAQFVWTPQLMFTWLEDPLAMFPESAMMSAGVPDPQARADLIAFLMLASVREYPAAE